MNDFLKFVAGAVVTAAVVTGVLGLLVGILRPKAAAK